MSYTIDPEYLKYHTYNRKNSLAILHVLLDAYDEYDGDDRDRFIVKCFGTEFIYATFGSIDIIEDKNLYKTIYERYIEKETRDKIPVLFWKY